MDERESEERATDERKGINEEEEESRQKEW